MKRWDCTATDGAIERDEMSVSSVVAPVALFSALTTGALTATRINHGEQTKKDGLVMGGVLLGAAVLGGVVAAKWGAAPIFGKTAADMAGVAITSAAAGAGMLGGAIVSK